ncbi:wax ester/triacylglycerol synthase family O-acyltransferase [Halieaceae bacterium IMCC14734]|uniref:diacylglycerol O-acyltransferase n=1 Tax=Candidatus Litorirhabdus singularis TaxID=2518993 RepID=A0ABT3TLL1_9GAMM|nr:wax ester/triacylglycerol synthase family O-acyltransferase [Candidatus Litorirhabdus singularis]MCX2982606.1 wax ester/triacylglycerol synthase family O-acyltransferase [Candidatus Litorirhabdus singularis]
MYQLSGLDNLMVAGELPDIPLHMSALFIYEPGGKHAANVDHALACSVMQSAIDQQFPILRCKLDALPLAMDRGYWVEDKHFDITNHIAHVSLPAPANWAELYRLCGEFQAQGLTLEQPLWEALLIEGLDHLSGVPTGSSAILVKIHHAVMDGKAALQLFASLHSLDPATDAPTMAAQQKANQSDYTSPAWWQKYGRAWWHNVQRPVDLARDLLKVAPGLWQISQESSTAEQPTKPVPKTRFNAHVDHDRVVGHITMSLPRLKSIQKQYGCTINDIALCVVAGGLRKFLADHDELPADSLVTAMPMDVRDKGDSEQVGNQVSIGTVPLHTDLRNIKARLNAIHAGSTRTRKRSAKLGPKAVLKVVDDLYPGIILWLGEWLMASGHIDELPMPVNTIISNVPGVPVEVYMRGNRLIDFIGLGPLAPNVGLFHVISSTPSHVNISFVSCKNFVGDGDEYRRALRAAAKQVLRSLQAG